MSQHSIYIESSGKESTEERFINYFIQYIGLSHNKHYVMPVGGWTNLKNIKSKLEETSDAGGKNIIIFDADDPTKDPNFGGFSKRTNKITNDLDDYEFNLFLFPNNTEDGDFESLLERIINPKYQFRLDCFHDYEKCLSSHDGLSGATLGCNLLLRKSKMYAYMDTFLKTEAENERFKKKDWFFYNNEIWDFDSHALQPLKDFLKGVY